jgi:hypothetical protein
MKTKKYNINWNKVFNPPYDKEKERLRKNKENALKKLFENDK